MSTFVTSRDTTQFFATGRRTWKTLKGKTEAVWPPHLETALLEGLERYQPETVGVKVNKPLNRFPFRNKFISDYILAVTGKKRTPKQVGSRLQQLRDTCKDNRIQSLLNPQESFELTSYCAPSTLQSPTISGQNHPLHSGPPSTRQPFLVYVRINLQRNIQPTIQTPLIYITSIAPTVTQVIDLPLSSFPTMEDRSMIYSMPVSVQFSSPNAISLTSNFYVYREGSGGIPIHAEHATLDLISSPLQGSDWTYRSTLIPKFWEICADFSKYTILQRLRPIPSDAVESVSNSISIIYTLTMPSPYIHNSPGEIVADRQHFLTDAHPDFLRIYGSTGGLVPENQLCFDNASSLQPSLVYSKSNFPVDGKLRATGQTQEAQYVSSVSPDAIPSWSL